MVLLVFAVPMDSSVQRAARPGLRGRVRALSMFTVQEVERRGVPVKLSELKPRIVHRLDVSVRGSGARGPKLPKSKRKGPHEMVKHPYKPGSQGVCAVCGFLHADRIHT